MIGDILCFQKDTSSDHVATSYPLPDPPAYFANLLRRVTVRFRPRGAPKDASQETVIELVRDNTYDEVARALGEKIGHDGDCVRIGKRGKGRGREGKRGKRSVVWVFFDAL